MRVFRALLAISVHVCCSHSAAADSHVFSYLSSNHAVPINDSLQIPKGVARRADLQNDCVPRERVIIEKMLHEEVIPILYVGGRAAIGEDQYSRDMFTWYYGSLDAEHRETVQNWLWQLRLEASLVPMGELRIYCHLYDNSRCQAGPRGAQTLIITNVYRSRMIFV